MPGARITIGERSGALRILANLGRDPRHGHGYCWRVACDCGEVINLTSMSFRQRVSCRKCGHRRGLQLRTKHGGAPRVGDKTLYNAWKTMRARCRDPKARAYRWYGAKGIKVCEEWDTDFAAFRLWALANGYGPGMTLERRDETKDYTPSNCSFISQSENSKRMRDKYHFVRKPVPVGVFPIHAPLELFWGH